MNKPGVRYGFERNYRDTVPIKDVRTIVGENKTRLIRAVGIVGLTCGVCLLPFERPAAWAKRTINHYCGRACAAEAKRGPRVKKLCIVCAGEFEVPQWKADRHVTCGPECRRMSYTEMVFMNGMVAMAKAKPHILSSYVCEVCDTPFTREPAWEKRYTPRFCSRKCQSAGRRRDGDRSQTLGL